MLPNQSNKRSRTEDGNGDETHGNREGTPPQAATAQAPTFLNQAPGHRQPFPFVAPDSIPPQPTNRLDDQEKFVFTAGNKNRP